jgi:hypothetical protein
MCSAECQFLLVKHKNEWQLAMMNRFIDDKTDETASIWSLITKTEPWLETFLTVHQETS